MSVKLSLLWLFLIVILVGVILLSLPLFAKAQSDTASSGPNSTNSIGKGAIKLNFQISMISPRSRYSELGLSGGYFVTDKFMLRLAFDSHIDLMNLDRKSQNSDSSYVYRSESDEHTNQQNIGFSFLYVSYQSLRNKISLYWGVGPEFSLGYFYSRTTSRQLYSPGYYSWRLDRTYSWAIGGSGILGIEWFATRKLSFLAEYGAEIDYYRDSTLQRSKSSNNPLWTQRGTRSGFRSNLLDTLIGIAYYF